jgi:3D (Asp-Asp-Asp) domain-containing protein
VRGRRFIALALAAGSVLGSALPAANGADAPGSLRAQAETLRARNATLGERRRLALLELYSLESKLARAQARVEALRARLADVRAERDSARTRLRIARDTASRAQADLARQVRTLYQHGEPDAIAILLGSDSLEEALLGLEGLQRSARQTDRVIVQVRAARRTTRTLSRTLGRRAAELERLTAAAAETAGALDAALAERRGYIASLAAEQELAGAQIASLEAEALEAQRRSAAVTAAQPAAPTVSYTAPAPSPPPAPSLQPSGAAVGGGRTLTVESTGYALPGTTASGLPVGWGIVAVDPSVIPLGTKMTVPGYGEAVAADTGSAVQGLIIDLWFPTTAQALEWGRRTVTITLH